MGKSSIHLQTAKAGTILHNERENYSKSVVFLDETNEIWNDSKTAFKLFREELAIRSEAYTKRTKQKLQKNTSTMISGVVNLEQHHTLKDMEKIKDYLEQRDHFKFYSYTQAQIRQYQTEHKKIMAIDNDQVRDQAFKNLDKKFPLLNSLKNEKAQQAYIYSLPIVDESGDTHFSTYIQLIGINTSNPSYTLICGVGEA